jgi:hypothetical protein
MASATGASLKVPNPIGGSGPDQAARQTVKQDAAGAPGRLEAIVS